MLMLYKFKRVQDRKKVIQSDDVLAHGKISVEIDF